jgi:YD repeat-containing protein
MERWCCRDTGETTTRRSLLSFSFCLFAALVFFGSVSSYGEAVEQTDKVRAGLVGPVQTVSAATSTVNTETDSFTDGQRVTTYNRQGQELETTYQDSSGGPMYAKTVYAYDPQGRKTTELSYEGQDQSPHCTMYYSYESQGRLVQKKPGEGWCPEPTTYTYDAQGRLLEESTEGHGRVVFTYDAQGRLIESTHSDDPHDPSLGIEKVVTSYDAQGNVWQLTTYYAHKIGEEDERPIPPPNKELYTYAYDGWGNWVVQYVFLCNPEAATGAYECRFEYKVRRLITYYAEE